MSDMDDRRSDKSRKKPTEGDSPSSSKPKQGQTSCEVGYGKPPESSRFTKGKSGNPRGRPRKAKSRRQTLSDAPSDTFLNDEAYRLIKLLENGEPIELPAIQAVMRSLTASAIKGNRLAGKYIIEHVAQKEALYLRLKAETYVRLERLKREGEEKIAAHEQRDLPAPTLIPHPEDIVLNPSTGEAWINGPETPEDARAYDHSARLRDHLIMRAVHAEKTRKEPLPPGTPCGYHALAHLLDAVFPPRYRLKLHEEVTLWMRYQYLPLRKLARHIDAEFAELRETRPPKPSLPPGLHEAVDRLSWKLTGSPW